MAVAFNTSVTSLEDELTQLILDKQIAARIDSQKKVTFCVIELFDLLQAPDFLGPQPV